MNRKQLEERALADHRTHRGSIILVTCLGGYNERDDSIELHLDPPLRCRVDRTREEDVLHWNGEWLDPYWDVTPLDRKNPAISGLRSFWTDGHSYNVCTGETQTAPWVKETGRFRRLESLIRRALVRDVRSV